MVPLAVAPVAYFRGFLVPRHKLALEAAALSQQLAVFKRKQPRPQLHRLDRLFWRLRSRFRRPGRPKVSVEIRRLVRRIHG